ncbi:ABC transporter ATP-binding protein [Lacimicrobium alkaliphilum]|uniref:ABC transporter n=1 Tax=Lacimicrobium alkaliphilum TaxID=1526571 RepID=A0ABQ1RHG0_9ALTE|nr:ABC transporter ATP-binding protein [Lacimicrobium alkaliphilum]GGD70558.1 ABC transporter [Lacimicrobium alkaliphilum]
MNLIEMENVSKSYGKQNVLDNISLNLPQGHVMGLLGQNGAGKTTLLKLCLGLLKADSGNIQVMDAPAWELTPAIKEQLGYVAQKSDTLHWMGVRQLLDYTGAFYRKWDNTKVTALMHRWQLDPKSKVSDLSEGQKQRLAIIQAIGHNPKLLILDEPVASLDPVLRREFIRELIDINIENNTSVLFSTHILSDLERVASDIAILRQGHICCQGSLDDIKERYVRLHLRSNSPLPRELPVQGLLHVEYSAHHLRALAENPDMEVISALEKQLNATAHIEPLGLDDIFLELHK